MSGMMVGSVMPGKARRNFAKRAVRKPPAEPPTIHTSVFCRDLTAATVRTLKKLGARKADGQIQSPFFCEQLVREIQDHIDWPEVRRRIG